MKKRRYAIVGISGRSRTFTGSILDEYSGNSEIVALYDHNHQRMKSFNEDNNLEIPSYGEGEFDKMVSDTKPDCAIISTTDATHHDFIVSAMQNNIDAVCEKPMTIDEEKVKIILDAEKNSSGEVQVTFNYRYMPISTKIREMIMDDCIGTPTSVDFNYTLDTYHGGSYFKRWNRYAEESGSLLVTKACHHFDLVNWWLGQKPVEVFAYGKMNFYGADGPYNPEKIDGRRCSTCETKCKYYLRHASPGGGSEDEHLISFNNPGKNELFGAVDGYYADRCIFDSDIDTWDTFTLSVMYDGGTMMSYSLNASAPYEGYKLAINGTKGRIETDCVHGKEMRLPFPQPAPQNIRYYPIFDGMQTIEVIRKGGGHGGGDPILKKEIFMGIDKEDRTKRFAGAMDGALSVLVGTAARKSLKTGKPVKIEDLLKG
ncbi:MAG: Gfo/Idh/MocA family protein [Planctomycetota bacterium]|jgi:predicted dehydrogenase